MSDSKKQNGLAAGGGVLVGLGVGFFLLNTSPLYFLGSILVGLGLGLMIESFVTKIGK